MKGFYFLSILLALFFSQISCVNAANYIVTSTADTSDNDGVSLRWAITQAITNTGPDTITFNIAGPAPHTILLSSDLPQIIGYDAQGTVIDGSTQPTNGYTGMSPKIIVDGGGVCTNGFDIEIPDCEVYGLVITRFQMNGITLTEDYINLTAGDSCIIGAPGKGNVIYNMDTTNTLYTNGISIGGVLYNSIHGCIIQSNKIGTDTSGKTSFPMYQGINLYSAIYDTTENILIGGGGVGQGNLISVQGAHEGNDVYNFGAHNVTLKGNIIGADITGHKIWGNTAVTGIYLYVNADSCTIGGTLPGEGNIVAYVEDTISHNGVGIELESADHCVIRRNSVYCNGQWGSIEMIGGNVCGGCFLSYAPPVITSADTTSVSGTASPNDVVELFYNNTGCTHPAFNCSGETYIATVTANGSGNWSYTGSITGGTTLTATATSLDSSRTSAFADCFTLPFIPPPPVASLSVVSASICQDACIDFTNLSQNSAIYQWIFNGAVPHTTSYINPVNVCYDSAGVFDVTLIAYNDSGVSDTLYLHNYIHVSANPPVPVITQSHDTLFSSSDPSYTAYQWYADTSAITGGTNSYLVISTSGNYTVHVLNESGCQSSKSIFAPVGIQQFTVYSLQFTLSPNPVDDQLILTGKGHHENKSFSATIFNVLGEKVLQSSIFNLQSEIVIDVSELKSGMYFVGVQNEESRWMGSFIKQ